MDKEKQAGIKDILFPENLMPSGYMGKVIEKLSPFSPLNIVSMEEIALHAYGGDYGSVLDSAKATLINTRTFLKDQNFRLIRVVHPEASKKKLMVGYYVEPEDKLLEMELIGRKLNIKNFRIQLEKDESKAVQFFTKNPGEHIFWDELVSEAAELGFLPAGLRKTINKLGAKMERYMDRRILVKGGRTGFGFWYKLKDCNIIIGKETEDTQSGFRMGYGPKKVLQVVVDSKTGLVVGAKEVYI